MAEEHGPHQAQAYARTGPLEKRDCCACLRGESNDETLILQCSLKWCSVVPSVVNGTSIGKSLYACLHDLFGQFYRTSGHDFVAAVHFKHFARSKTGRHFRVKVAGRHRVVVSAVDQAFGDIERVKAREI